MQLARMRTVLILAVAVTALVGSPALAQDAAKDIFGGGGKPKESFADLFKAEASFEPKEARPGDMVTWKLTMNTAPGWHTYPTRQVDPRAASTINELKWENEGGLRRIGALQEPSGKPELDPVLGFKIVKHKGQVVWTQRFQVPPDAKPGQTTVTARLKAQVCQASCITGTVELAAPLTILEGSPLPPGALNAPSGRGAGTDSAIILDAVASLTKEIQALQEAIKNGTAARPAEQPTGTGQPNTREDYEVIIAKLEGNGRASQTQTNSDLLPFLLTGALWGFISLVTPCVFPMIPITVSFFLKQSEKEHHRPITNALVYCATIVVVLTIAAVSLLSTFQTLSQNPLMNFGLGALFVFFALSLFGMYEIELPAGLARFTSAREGQGGLVGTMFMALTFTIVSFACVAPFLGGFAGTAVQSRPLYHIVLGGLAFAATFASPFFLLALFPSFLKKLPKSGSWLNSVKVVMGFLELAAALKFLRAGELYLLQGGTPAFFTYDLVLGMWVAMCVLCGLYLLGIYRLPHDTPIEHLSVSRLLFSLLFVSLGFYFLPALFHGPEGEKQRPGGQIFAWVDSFLLPEPDEGKGELPWSKDLKQTLAKAREQQQMTGQRRLVFIDFTGVGCTNCKINEKDMFPRPRIKELLKQYALVQLYTDTGDVIGKDNLWFQDEAFGDVALPLYVILEPLPDGTIKVWGTRGGKLNDEEDFARFLREPLTGGGMPGGAVQAMR
jgi:thiol:disulfide interchange protein DsbD